MTSPLTAPTTSHFNVVCSSLPCTGEGRNGLSIPRASHHRAAPLWTIFSLIFYPCCPLRGHRWTAFLIPNDCPLSSFTFLKTFLSSFSNPNPPFYLFYPPLLLIRMLHLISGDIHPNPGPIDPCSVCSRRVTWGNKSVQCVNCSLWLHLSYSGLPPADFRKISPEHSWTFQCCHLPLKFPPLTPNLIFIFKYLQNSKTLIFKN